MGSLPPYAALLDYQITNSTRGLMPPFIPSLTRQMSFTNVEPRLTLEARTMLTKLVGILIADGSIDAAEDAPFNPFCPGDDPKFHELVQDLVDQTLEFMADTAHDMVQN